VFTGETKIKREIYKPWTPKLAEMSNSFKTVETSLKEEHPPPKPVMLIKQFCSSTLP